MRTRAKDVMRAAALIGSCIAPGVLGARAPGACACARPRIDARACGAPAAVLGDVTGGCAAVLGETRPRPPASHDVPIGGLPQLPIAGVLPVSLGATPALPRLTETESAPGELPGGLPPVRPAARSLPGLPSIPVVRPVRAEPPVEPGPREPRRPEAQLGALALGVLIAVIRRQKAIYSDQ